MIYFLIFLLLIAIGNIYILIQDRIEVKQFKNLGGRERKCKDCGKIQLKDSTVEGFMYWKRSRIETGCKCERYGFPLK